MSNLAIYDHFWADESQSHAQKQVTIILYGLFQDHEVLARSIASYLRVNAAPERVVIFGLEEHEVFLREALKNNSPFMARLNFSWGEGAESRVCTGIVYSHSTAVFREVANKLLVDAVKLEFNLASRMVSQAIFKESKCLQRAPRGSHFSKTSKAHCDTFIRASNTLITSRNTLALAYFLQPFVAQSAKRILVDTSAIASLAYAACHMAVRSGALAEMPIIDSFRSYEGLSDTDLEDMGNSLFIISASTSGNLARSAFSKGVERAKLITLFLLSEEQDDQNVLCQLRHDTLNPDGPELLESWSEVNCPLCKRGSTPIQIGGDLFLTALPQTVCVDIVKRHLPDEQRAVISRLSGHGVFRAHRHIGGNTSEISLDLQSAFVGATASPEILGFRAEWERLLRRFIPANVTHIVHPIYPYATELAQSISSFGLQFVKPNFILSTGADLASSSVAPNGCAVVTTPCLDDHIELMGINRDLRAKIPGGTALYLFPVIRASSESQAKGIIMNLTFGDRGANTYSLYQMHKIYLPENRSVDPWHKEIKCIKVIEDWLEENGDEIPEYLAKRKKLLNESSVEGLIDNLFWPDSSGKSLKIRSNFVLLPTDDGEKYLDQVDIFVVISALLNNLRQLDGPDSLNAVQYQKKVLSPKNFIRFNDGVIQAALLRAARGSELNYAASEDGKLSTELTNHVLEMIRGADSENGEALSEFMLAISVGALRLESDDNNRIVESILSAGDAAPPVVKLFAEALKAGIMPI